MRARGRLEGALGVTVRAQSEYGMKKRVRQQTPSHVRNKREHRTKGPAGLVKKGKPPHSL